MILGTVQARIFAVRAPGRRRSLALFLCFGFVPAYLFGELFPELCPEPVQRQRLALTTDA